jgi:hypothetical protein
LHQAPPETIIPGKGFCRNQRKKAGRLSTTGLERELDLALVMCAVVRVRVTHLTLVTVIMLMIARTSLSVIHRMSGGGEARSDEGEDSPSDKLQTKFRHQRLLGSIMIREH